MSEKSPLLLHHCQNFIHHLKIKIVVIMLVDNNSYIGLCLVYFHVITALYCNIRSAFTQFYQSKHLHKESPLIFLLKSDLQLERCLSA